MSIYKYILRVDKQLAFAGFRGARHNALMGVGQPPHVRGDGDMGPSDEEGGRHPCPEDEEFHKVPDADSMEEAIGKFMEGLEGQEHAGFSQIHSLLQRLPAPVQNKPSSMTHSEAIEGDFLPNMSEEQQKRFTPDKEQDQNTEECVALADSNFNVPCESGIRHPSQIAIIVP